MIRALRVAIVTVWGATSLWLGSDAGLSVLALLLVLYGGFAMLLGWVIASSTLRYRHERLSRIWLEPTVVLLILGLILTGAPFRVRFLVSRPALEQYVASAVANREPRRVALFKVLETERVSSGVVRLITTECMFDDCGVVFSQSEPPRIGEDTYRRIHPRWWQWERSW